MAMKPMTELVDVAKTSVQGVAIFFAVFFLGLQLQGLSLEAGISASYVAFYSGLIPLALMSIIAISIFRVRYLELFDFGIPVKFAIIAGWTLLIVFLSFSGTQIVPVPRASVEGFQIGASEQLYLSSVIPGILEDLVYNVGLPMTLLVIIALVAEFGFGIEIGTGSLVGFAVIAAIVAAIGYNVWVVPGFASAHVPSYGVTNPGLFAAFFFSFGQSLVYILTGIFLPLAHILHNMIVFFGSETGFNVGALSITGSGI